MAVGGETQRQLACKAKVAWCDSENGCTENDALISPNKPRLRG